MENDSESEGWTLSVPLAVSDSDEDGVTELDATADSEGVKVWDALADSDSSDTETSSVALRLPESEGDEVLDAEAESTALSDALAT